MITKQTVISYLSSPAFGRAFSYNPQPGTVEVVADPQVDGTYAAQFTDVEDREPRTVHLLFVTGAPSEEDAEAVLEENLEEVEYDSWPPVSGALRFF